MLQYSHDIRTLVVPADALNMWSSLFHSTPLAATTDTQNASGLRIGDGALTVGGLQNMLNSSANSS